MNFFRVPPKAAPIADRLFAIACPGGRRRAMGFDVIYFPPIHPIGHTNRKGRNNSITSEPGDPGVPYAIGSEGGGHKAIEPSLGTLEDFDWLRREIRNRGMEIALDFAINCSPDHPYVGSIPSGSTNAPMARSNTLKIRRKNMRTFIL